MKGLGIIMISVKMVYGIKGLETRVGPKAALLREPRQQEKKVSFGDFLLVCLLLGGVFPSLTVPVLREP